MTVLSTDFLQSAVAERAKREKRHVDSGDFAGVIGDRARRQPVPCEVPPGNRFGLAPVISGLPFQPTPIVNGLPFQPEPAPAGLPFQPSPIVDGLPFKPEPGPEGLPFEPPGPGDGPLTIQRLAQMLGLRGDWVNQT